MVLPVPLPDRKVRWLLNVESSEQDAFADEEQSSVELLLDLVGVILDRAATLQLKTAIFESVADGVVHTNDAGVILAVNPAAAGMLGIPQEKLSGLQLADFLQVQRPGAEYQDGEEGEDASRVPAASPKPATLMIQECWESTEAAFVRAGRPPLTVLISSARLPSEPGGKVFVASDLTVRKRMHRLEVVKEGLAQLASEIRMPIALAATFLDDAREPGADVPDLIAKATKQIHKADLPLERILRLQVAAEDGELSSSTIDLRETVKSAIDDLPGHESSAVLQPAGKGKLLAEAAPEELHFCIQNVLAYLLRVRSQKEKVGVQIGRTRSRAFISMGLTDAEGTTPVALPQDAARDLTLVEPVLQGLIARMGGEYEKAGTGFQFVLQKTEAKHAAIDHS
jgi:PAS domain-containing protein